MRKSKLELAILIYIYIYIILNLMAVLFIIYNGLIYFLPYSFNFPDQADTVAVPATSKIIVYLFIAFSDRN